MRSQHHHQHHSLLRTQQHQTLFTKSPMYSVMTCQILVCFSYKFKYIYYFLIINKLYCCLVFQAFTNKYTNLTSFYCFHLHAERQTCTSILSGFVIIVRSIPASLEIHLEQTRSKSSFQRIETKSWSKKASQQNLAFNGEKLKVRSKSSQQCIGKFFQKIRFKSSLKRI